MVAEKPDGPLSGITVEPVGLGDAYWRLVA
jgi:hypothetical protein